MKAPLALALFVTLASPAFAQPRSHSQAGGVQRRASTTNMTCAAAAGIVNQQGEVVLGTGGDRFDRFVRAEGLCPTGLYGRPAFEPTRDNPQCLIGYYCTGTPPFFERD